MARPDPVIPPTNPSSDNGQRPATTDQLETVRASLTRGQRLLAILTAAAVLVSGVNALVQVARVLVEWGMQGR